MTLYESKKFEDTVGYIIILSIVAGVGMGLLIIFLLASSFTKSFDTIWDILFYPKPYFNLSIALGAGGMIGNLLLIKRLNYYKKRLETR